MTAIGLTLLRIYALILLAVGIALAVGGTHLLNLGGSPYYLVCGVAVIASAVLLFLRRAAGALLYGLMFLGTVAWAIWESGASGWALMPRVISPAVLGAVLLLPAVRRGLERRTDAWSAGKMIASLVAAITLGAVLRTVVPPHIPADPIFQAGVGPAPTAAAPLEAGNGDWLHYGNDAGGRRFSTLTQITPENVNTLELAWTYKINDVGTRTEVTPLKIGDTLYVCSTYNEVIALDAETGKERWRFNPKVDQSVIPTAACRGVSYYKKAETTGVCAERIITATLDARIIALDAKDGQPCADFGANGETSLLTGMGDVPPGYYYVTSAPMIVQGKAVVGGWVMDSQYVDEPSGVIRAYDAVTGKLAWAWDMGAPDRTGEPPEGETYTRGTPNSWSPLSADETLGLVYVPLGNPTPDSFGAFRRPFDETYGSALVALDAATGRPRWHFQTVHHDLWDQDLPAQPTLIDYPSANGVIPALLQPTKRGELFVLNRATGEPLLSVEERPAPQTGAVPEEKLAPTQPYQTGVPSFAGANLTERSMWGITAIDQMMCRILFRESRYDGPSTPPGLTHAIVMPGSIGGMEWGGVTVDTRRNIALVNSMNMPNRTLLVPRAEAEKQGIKRMDNRDKKFQELLVTVGLAQEQTPYALVLGPFLSPLYVPCNQPPFGKLSAVDLTTGKLIWTQAFGTARELGPIGLRSRLPITIGTPNMGGAVATQTGVFFIAAAQDRRFRAYDTATGEELWNVGLPGGGVATPMTYQSPKSGRQFVALAVGHDGVRKTDGNYIMAYTLPKSGK